MSTSTKVSIAGVILSAVLQALSFAYFIGGLSARVAAVEKRLDTWEQKFVYEVRK